MRRRTLLCWTGLFGTIALAGCAGGDSDAGGTETPTGEETTEEETPTTSPTDTPTATASELSVTDTAISTRSADCLSGEGDRVEVELQHDASRVLVRGTIETSDPCHEAVLDGVDYDADTGTLTVAVDAEPTDEVCVDCVGGIEYEATVSLSGGVPETVAVTHQGRPVGDGKTPATTPTPTPDGTTVEEASLTVTSVESGQQTDSADVDFDTDNGVVVVDGIIWGSDGCKTAELDKAAYDPATDTLTVDVVTKDREGAEDEACTQAIVEIDYRARVVFSGVLPKTVDVRHDDRPVASASHGSATAGDA